MMIGISQPTFMPWIGYFAFLDKIDKLIFLDDVQFDKRSWQQRNYIKLNKEKSLLTISVKSKGKFDQKISDVEIIYDKNLDLIKKKIFFAYNKAKYYKNYNNEIFDILDKKYTYLSELNIELIKHFTRILNLNTDFDYSSNYSLNFKKENLIFELCKKNNCKEYLSTLGSKQYLESLNTIPETNIKILYFDYKDTIYNQLSGNFISKLSILDLLFNEGSNSINIIRQGFRII